MGTSEITFCSSDNSYEGECLVIVWVILLFLCYFDGSPFILVTDHQPLNFFMESYWLIGKLTKWALILHEYDFDIIHKVGRVNQDVDGLGSNPRSN